MKDGLPELADALLGSEKGLPEGKVDRGEAEVGLPAQKDGLPETAVRLPELENRLPEGKKVCRPGKMGCRVGKLACRKPKVNWTRQTILPLRAWGEGRWGERLSSQNFFVSLFQV